MPSRSEHEGPGAARAWYGVAVLTLVYVFALADRQILSLLVEPVCRDLDISKNQIALLHGVGFVLLYTLLGIPLATLADRVSRRGLVAGGLGVWSAMTVLCGTARSYAQLFLGRLGVGMGEAALSPAAYSWIAASFPRARVATALSVYSTGIYLGSGLSLVLSGWLVGFVEHGGARSLPWLSELKGWQVPFVVIGGLGLLCVPLLFTLREPPRAEQAALPCATWGDLLRRLSSHSRAFAAHHLGVGCLCLSGYAVNFWTPKLLMERHGFERGQSGIVYGLVLGVAGTLGAYLAGMWADRSRARGARDANLRVAQIATLATVPFVASFPLISSTPLAIALLALLSFFTGAGFGVAPAAVQELVAPELRGRASGLYLFVINLIGGLGMLSVTVLADQLFGGALHQALALVGACAGILGTLCFAWGRPVYARALSS